MKHFTYIGSNQYARKIRVREVPAWQLTRANYKDLIVIMILAFVVLWLAINYHADIARAHATDSLTWVKKATASELKKPFVEHPTTEQQQVIDEIKRVFGDDAEKAFLLLSCENHALNPKAVNVNSDAEHTKDVGIFQVNTKWQGVTNMAFLTDYKINIAMAWSIYSRDGHSFKLWTCGRKFGI